MGALPKTTTAASLRPARWYDASPSLAFALQCLMLAPGPLRERITDQVASIMGLGAPETRPSSAPKRREDGPNDSFWQALNQLKTLPEHQRQHTARFILDQLDMV